MKRLVSSAASNGHLECLKYAHENGCPWNELSDLFYAAAANGHLECLKYLHEKGCPWDEWTCSEAARNGHLECLEILRTKTEMSRKRMGVQDTCSNAAKNGHLECLKYLHENGCPWDKYTCQVAAALNGQLECLKYAHENGCPLCDSAAESGHLECLKYAHENGCHWTYYLYKSCRQPSYSTVLIRARKWMSWECKIIPL